jgi:hypothetical protein
MIKIGLICLLGAISFGCTESREEEVMSENEAWVEHCIGRNLIKVPDSYTGTTVVNGVFKEAGLAGEESKFDIIVYSTKMTTAEFNREIRKRRVELQENSSENVDVFEYEKDLGGDAIMFRVKKLEDAYESEIRFLRGGSLVLIRLDSYGRNFVRAEERLVQLATRIHELDQSNVKESSLNFCLGPLMLRGVYSYEYASYDFRNHKGMHLNVDINTYIPDDRLTLIERMSGPDSLLKKFDVQHKVLRKDERLVVGMRAQEWLGWAKLSEDDDAKTLKFVLETMRNKPGRTFPKLSVTLDSAQPLEDGTPTRTTLSDEQAIQLWDSIVSSIRTTGGE